MRAKNDGSTVTITKERYEELLYRDVVLTMLEKAAVEFEDYDFHKVVDAALRPKSKKGGDGNA